MLAEELQDRAVSALILLLDPLILQIAPGGHPPVDLVAKRLHMLRALQVRLELLHLGRVLVLGRQQRQRDADLLGLGRVDHRRVALGARGVGRVGCGAGEGDDLAAPAEADHAPGLDAGVFLLEFF